MTDLENMAAELLEFMGNDWMEAHEAQPHREPHLLAGWLYQYQNSLPDPPFPSQQLLQIGSLVWSIRTLRQSNVLHADSRIENLRSDDAELVASTIYELRVAAYHASSGDRVMFIPEANTPTPDILMNDRIEVECKRRSSASKQDNKRSELYGVLQRKLRSVFPQTIDHSAIHVEVDFEVEPRREFVDKIVERARECLREQNAAGPTVVAAMGFSAEITVVPAGVGPTGLFLPRGETGFDFMSTEGIALDSLGTFGRILSLYIRCGVKRDVVKGTIRSVKSAASQFSGRMPAIVSVDVSAIAHSADDQALAQIGEGVTNILKSNTSISRVEFWRTEFAGDPPQQSYQTSVEILENPDARFPIAEAPESRWAD